MKVFVNKKVVHVDDTIILLELCNSIGIDIPRYCYYDKLVIAGNCRMCLVEMERVMKPIAACSIEATENMSILTNSLMVKKAREGVMELLLVNHPLDCPVCDQGGECDLQDQVMLYGNDRGRFYDQKRNVLDKQLGVFIKTVMTRCIHCTRCVRFMSDIAGVGDLGVMGRGNKMEIGTYVSKILVSEISGNIIDLCPVGALTVKPFAFIGRSWEMRTVPVIDVFDGMGSNLLLSYRNNVLMRVIPLKNNNINEEWITDKVRFFIDGVVRQRLTVPLIAKKSYDKENNLLEVTWEEACKEFVKKIYRDRYIFEGIVGQYIELESIYLFKYLLNKYGSEYISYNNGVGTINVDFVNNYRFETLFKEFDNIVKGILLIGVNLRFELPLLLVKMRRQQRTVGLFILIIGPSLNLYINAYYIGSGSLAFKKFFEGKSSYCWLVNKLNLFVVFLGLNSVGIKNCNSYLNITKKYINFFVKRVGVQVSLNIFTQGANSVGFYDLGLNNKRVQYGRKEGKKLLFILGADMLKINYNMYDSIIFQGHHGTNFLQGTKIIFPGVTFLEKDGLYVNLEGLVQESKKGSQAIGQTRVDWRILYNLIELIGYPMGDKSLLLSNLRKSIGNIVKYSKNSRIKGLLQDNINISEGAELYIDKKQFNSFFMDYYFTNSIVKASNVLASAACLYKKRKINLLR